MYQRSLPAHRDSFIVNSRQNVDIPDLSHVCWEYCWFTTCSRVFVMAIMNEIDGYYCQKYPDFMTNLQYFERIWEKLLHSLYELYDIVMINWNTTRYIYFNWFSLRFRVFCWQKSDDFPEVYFSSSSSSAFKISHVPRLIWIWVDRGFLVTRLHDEYSNLLNYVVLLIDIGLWVDHGYLVTCLMNVQ